MSALNIGNLARKGLGLLIQINMVDMVGDTIAQ